MKHLHLLFHQHTHLHHLQMNGNTMVEAAMVPEEEVTLNKAALALVDQDIQSIIMT